MKLSRGVFVLLGDFKEVKDDNQNTILSGEVKNIGSKRADFVKITFYYQMQIRYL